MVGPVRADLGISDFQISLLQGFAFALLYAVLGLPLGLAADRLPRRRVIFVGVFVWALAATACGLARNFPQLMAARLFVGAGEAALAPAAYSILSDMFPKRRLTMALSVYTFGALLGSSLSLAIGGAIVQTAGAGAYVPFLGLVEPWRFAFLATGIPGIALAFLIFIIPEPARRGLASAAKSSWADLFAFMRARAAFFACHFTGFACMMGMSYARLSWLPEYFRRAFGWEVARIGYTLALFSFFSGVLALLLTGWLVDRMTARGITDAHMRVYVGGGLLAAVAGSACFLVDSPAIFFVLAALATIPLTMAAVAASAIQVVTPARLRGRASAVYLLFVSLSAMTIGPAVVGFFTTNVFADDAMLGTGLALTSAILGMIGTVAFALGLAPMRRAAASVATA